VHVVVIQRKLAPPPGASFVRALDLQHPLPLCRKPLIRFDQAGWVAAADITVTGTGTGSITVTGAVIDTAGYGFYVGE